MKAAITIGRMNPPTAGHMYLVSQVLQEPADKWALVLQGGNLKDKDVKNMFSHELKSSIIQGSDVVDIDKLEIINLPNAYLPVICEKMGLETSDQLVVILGEEDVQRAQDNLKYIPTELLEELPEIEIKGIPMKVADEEQRVSGTLIRSFIFKNDFDQFFKHFEMQDEEKARKIFGKLRAAVLSNLKLRFPNKEVDGKLVFDLPKTKAGKLNSAANKIISNILQNLEGYGKEIMWEGILKENPDSSFFNANAFGQGAKTFIVGKDWWAWGDKSRKFSFYSETKGGVTHYNSDRANNMHYLLIPNIIKNVKGFAKKYLDVDTQEYKDGMDDDLIEKNNCIRGRFWPEKAPDGSDIIAFWHDRDEVMQYPLIKRMIKEFSNSENIYVDFNKKWEETDEETAIKSQDSSSQWTGKLKKKMYKNQDRSFQSHHQDQQKDVGEKWREKIYNTVGIWDHFFKTGKFLNENPDESFFKLRWTDRRATTFLVGKDWWAYGKDTNSIKINNKPIELTPTIKKLFKYKGSSSYDKLNHFNLWLVVFCSYEGIRPHIEEMIGREINWNSADELAQAEKDFYDKQEFAEISLLGRHWPQNTGKNDLDVLSFWGDEGEVKKYPLVTEIIDNLVETRDVYVDFSDGDEDPNINIKSSKNIFQGTHQKVSNNMSDNLLAKRGIYVEGQMETIPQPSTEMTYLNVLHPVNLNKDLIGSFRRRNLVVPSTVTDTWGNKVERMGRYEMDSWNRLKNSIRKGGIWPPITVRILDDFTCYIEDGNHRLEAVKELGDQYEKGTMPVQLQIHPSLSFKAINNFFKNWNEVGIIDNRDYAGLLNQLNLLRIEQHIKLPDKIELLSEGGNVFSDVTPFDKSKIELLNNSVNKILNKVGITAIPIGSTTKPNSKPLFGDMDMIVDEQQILNAFDAKDVKTARKALRNFFEENGITSAQTGVSVHARIPIEDSYHQIDIMIVSNAEPISKFHMHDIPQNSPYKGFNKLFVIWYLAKQKGLFWSPFQGLFDTTPEGKKGELLSTDIDEVARLLLGKNANKEDLASVESILNFLPKEKADEVLAGVRQDKAWKENPIQENILQEGGAFGHMAHGYEVFKGTELFTFFDNIFSGKYEMYEKVDGLNVVWGIENGQVVFNLGGSQGNISSVEEKYSIYHPAGDAFRAGFQAIKEAVERMSPAYMRALGLLDGNMINSEILFGEIPNTVPYSKTTNYIVLHGVMGDKEVKNEKKLLNQLAQEIGQLTVTAPVMNYEGDDLDMIKTSLSTATSKWKFAGPMKINPETLKEKLGDEVEKWKSYPEAQTLLKPDITKDEALEAAKGLSQKIGSVVLSKMVSQLRDPDAEQIEGLPGIEGIALYGEDGDLFKLTGDFRSKNEELWEPINRASKIVSGVWEFIAKDVLGLKTKKVGADFISRFAADPEKYLKTKSSDFAPKRSQPARKDPSERANIQQILVKIDEAMRDLKNIFNEVNQSELIKKENILKSLRVNAFKLSKARNFMKSATTYSDVVIANAKGLELMENLTPNKNLKETLKERLNLIDKKVLINELEKIELLLNKKLLNEAGISTVTQKIKTIINLLSKKGGEVSEDIINRIYALIRSNTKEFEQMVDKIISFGIPEDHAKAITEHIFTYSISQVKKISNYLSNRTVTIDDLGLEGNLLSIFSSIGLPQPFISFLFSYGWKTLPAMGDGEVMFSILMKDAMKPGKGAKGDVLVGGKELEVKGAGARVKGAKGYGQGIEFSRVVAEKLQDINNKHKLNINIPEPGGTEYNIVKRNSGYFDNFIQQTDAIKNGFITRSEIIKTYKQAMNSVYYKMDTSWINRNISRNGTIIDLGKFHEDWFNASFKYYSGIEEFDTLVFCDKSGNYQVFKPDEENPYDRLNGSIGLPGFSSSVGSGMTFKFPEKVV